MKNIKILKYVTTGIDPQFSNIDSIEIEDSTFASGSFGEIYHCVNINGSKPNVDIVVKILKGEFIDKNLHTTEALQNALQQKHQELKQKGQSLLKAYPSLMAVPQFSFEGMLNGEKIKGYGAYDLTKLGYIEYEDILNNDDFYNQFYNVYPKSKKNKLVFNLIKAMLLLKSIDFIHADIKEKAFFINMQKGNCAIIDFDSGAVLSSLSGNNKPTTFGSRQDWLAPEIIQQLGKSNNKNKANVTFYSDAWAIAYAVFYIYFGDSPYYFLDKVSPKVMKQYTSSFKWPNIEASVPYVNQDYISYLDTYSKKYNKIFPKALKEGFEITFSQGYQDPEKRYTYKQWLEAFKTLQELPVIKAFNVDVDYISKKQNITFNWNVVGASRICIDNIDVTGKSSYNTVPTKSHTYKLKVYNDFNASVSENVSIKVSNRPPEIIFFKPDKKVRKSNKAIELNWQVKEAHKIILYPDNIDVTGKQSIKVKPLKDTMYKIEAESFFGVKNSIKTEVHVSKDPAKIVKFDYDLVDISKEIYKLSWKVKNAEEIFIEPTIGEVTNKKKIKSIEGVFEYNLIAKTIFGIETKKKMTINSLFYQDPTDKFFCKNPNDDIFFNQKNINWQ